MERYLQSPSLEVGDDGTVLVSADLDRIPPELQEELVKAEAELQKERLTWMRAKVLHTSLHSVLEDAKLGMNTTLQQAQVDELVEKVRQADVKFCTQKCQSMSQHKKSASPTEAERTLCSLIEKDIKRTCEDVLAYHDGLSSETPTSGTVFAARAMHLGKIVQEEKKQLEMRYSELSDVRKTENQLFSSCMEELLQLADILTKIMVKYRIKLQPKMDSEKFSNLVSRCEALALKAENMTLKLKKELYTPESIAALQVIRTELNQCKKNKHQEIIAIEKQLNDFKNLGEEFNAIVTEYNQLQTDIEKREWVLKQWH